MSSGHVVDMWSDGDNTFRPQRPDWQEKARCRGALDCLSFCLLSTMRQVHTTFLNGHTQDDACGSTGPRTHRNGTALRSPSGPGTAPSPWDSCTDTRVFYPVNGLIGDVRTLCSDRLRADNDLASRQLWALRGVWERNNGTQRCSSGFGHISLPLGWDCTVFVSDLDGLETESAKRQHAKPQTSESDCDDCSSRSSYSSSSFS